MRVLICGGREFADRALVEATLDKVLAKYGDALVIVTGSASGADMLAEEWAKSRGVPYMGFPARWKRHGNYAGPERNKRMRDEAKPDAAIAFKGQKGTANMVSLLEDAGIPVWKVNGEGTVG